MLQTRQRNTMTLQWNTWHMSSSFLLLVSQSILWSTNSTRAGILGFCHPLRAVSTCLVSILILFSALVFSLWLFLEFLNPHYAVLNLTIFHFLATGFIMMCPQLFINYKLKSVAHLPWRQMTYKFLNTIIDDLFAFVIKMPILHRLSVFRDGELLIENFTFIF